MGDTGTLRNKVSQLPSLLRYIDYVDTLLDATGIIGMLPIYKLKAPYCRYLVLVSFSLPIHSA